MKLNGHSIECRILVAENPKEGFLPCPGEVQGINLPGGFGVRVDQLYTKDIKFRQPMTHDCKIDCTWQYKR